MEAIAIRQFHTRSSANADRQREALFQSKSCQTTVRTASCSVQQIKVVELERHGRPTCNKQCASSRNASTVVGAINKPDRRRVLSITQWTCRGEIFEVQSLDKVPLRLEIHEFPYHTVQDRWKEAFMPLGAPYQTQLDSSTRLLFLYVLSPYV